MWVSVYSGIIKEGYLDKVGGARTGFRFWDETEVFFEVNREVLSTMNVSWSEHMDSKYKRVNVLITPGQHQKVAELGLSLSGLVRDLLRDRFSDTIITLTVTKDTKKLYDHVISNFGSDDLELEPYIVEALDKFLHDKVKEIDGLRRKLKK